MKVFKFGGASVNSAESIKNVARIINTYSFEKLLVVISAMGKTTNMLEELLHSYLEKRDDKITLFNVVKEYHLTILKELFPNSNHSIYKDIEQYFSKLQDSISKTQPLSYDFEYDQIVSFGELFSTLIVSTYLNEQKVNNVLIDVRKIIHTNNNYRDAGVDWKETEVHVKKQIQPIFENEDIIITQGFIGGTTDGYTTTLGREGSDYSAAIFAYCLNAKEMVIWKDVSGFYNADPKYFPEACKLEKIPYKEAIELAYYGASIIHPKTIKPLENKEIPLFVKSFVNPTEEGSVINNTHSVVPKIPSYIFKKQQVLLSILPRDFSFIAENNLFEIFEIFSKLGIKVNVMQNSAISFSVCINENKQKFDLLKKELQKKFRIKYNLNVELITIRHYNSEAIKKVCFGKKILLEQRSRLTTQIVVI